MSRSRISQSHPFLRSSKLQSLFGLVCAGLLLSGSTVHATDARRVEPLRVLTVGGGPSLQYNQVAIESNVRYLHKLLPKGTVQTTLFADGDANHASVLYDDDTAKQSNGEFLMDLFLQGTEAESDGGSHYRKPNIGKVDGPSKRAEFARQIGRIAQEPDLVRRRVLLYFTGHGSPGKADYDNNVYDMWGKDEALSVRECAHQIEQLPTEVPVTLVMVQCFSGAFGNLLFEGGDPKGDVISRDFAGFYATVNNRVAAGCTSAVNEAEYHDFTSYFFAALTGRDRVGRAVTGCDYNHDGRVGMNEAYCYTLLNDESIDVPVCTSDFFLRRFVPMRDADVFQTPWPTIVSWADPAQKQALEGLSDRLKLTGDDRLKTAYEKAFRSATSGNRDPQWLNRYRQARTRFDSLLREGRRDLLRRYPDLRSPSSPTFAVTRKDAIARLDREAMDGKWKDLLDANDAVDKADQEGENLSIAESKLLRIVRLGKSIVLAHELQQVGTPEIKARYQRLIEAEGRTLLPPVGALPKDTADSYRTSGFLRGTMRSPSSCNCTSSTLDGASMSGS
jgi:hypothetical protein